MGEAPEAPSTPQHDEGPEVKPLKSNIVSRGLIALPSVLAFWRRRPPQPA